MIGWTLIEQPNKQTVERRGDLFQGILVLGPDSEIRVTKLLIDRLSSVNLQKTYSLCTWLLTHFPTYAESKVRKIMNIPPVPSLPTFTFSISYNFSLLVLPLSNPFVQSLVISREFQHELYSFLQHLKIVGPYRLVLYQTEHSLSQGILHVLFDIPVVVPITSSLNTHNSNLIHRNLLLEYRSRQGPVARTLVIWGRLLEGGDHLCVTYKLIKETRSS